MAEAAAQTDPDLESPELTKIARWVAEIDLYNKEAASWVKRSKLIVRRYKDEREDRNQSSQRRFNVLWSNVQTLLPALYARNPKPDIQRRFKDADPLGRVASTVLERSVSYFCDTDLFAVVCRACVLDYLLPGRGTSWIRYDPTFEAAAAEITDDAQEGEGAAAPAEKIIYEKAFPDYVHSDDFGHNIARTWDEVWCGWRIVYMSRKALKKRFGEEKGALPPLDHREKDLKDRTIADPTSKATIYELWDKERKVAAWFHKDIPDALDVRDDPLGLEDFFPFPKPMFTNLANDSLIPVPDYAEYQDQADEVDSLTARIAAIQKCIKVAGVYNAAIAGVGTLLNQGVENKLVPVNDWASFAEKGGIESNMDLLPIAEYVEAVTELYKIRAQVLADLYEITGISDIVRGQTDPNETATSQQIKSNFATMRISDRQREVQRFVRGMIRIMVDVIANHFQMDTIKLISGVQLFTKDEKATVQQIIAQYQQATQQAKASGQQAPPEPQPPNGLTKDQVEQMMSEPTWEDVEALIRNKALRCFRIDIETDSTIKADEEAEKESRVEFLKALGEFLKGALEAGQQQPELVPFLGQAMMFGVRAFPVGKDLEGALNVALTKMEKASQNPRPRPDPEMAKVQADAAARQQQTQADMQAKQMQTQADAQAQTAKLASEEKLAEMKLQITAQTDRHRNELEAARDQARLQSEAQLAQMKMESEARLQETIAHIKAAASIEVARITSKAAISDGVNAEAREQAATDLGEVVKPSVESIREHVQALAESIKAAHAPQDNTALHGHINSLTHAVAGLAASHAQTQASHAQMMEALTSEREIVRGPDGRASGVRTKIKAVGGGR